MSVTFSADDLGRVFEARTLTRGRSLVLIGSVEVSIAEDTITGMVTDGGLVRTATIKPRLKERRVTFDSNAPAGSRTARIWRRGRWLRSIATRRCARSSRRRASTT